MFAFTDCLAYKDGVSHRSDDSFNFNGQQIFKIVGWERQADVQEWRFEEKSWGDDWGENDYILVLASDKSTQPDFLAIGVSACPHSMAEYYIMKEQMNIRD